MASRHAGGRDQRRDGGLNYFERRGARVRREGEEYANRDVTERLIERGKEDIRNSLKRGEFHCLCLAVVSRTIDIAMRWDGTGRDGGTRD